MLLLFVGSGAVEAQNLVAASAVNQAATKTILQKFVAADVEIIEKVSYDEQERLFYKLPPGFDLTKIHFMDAPYLKHALRTSHVEEFLLAKGVYAQVITYLSEKNAGENWATRPKFRLVLPERVLALDADFNIVVETPNIDDVQRQLTASGQKMLEEGLFIERPFPDVDLESLAKLEQEGYKWEAQKGSYLFKKKDSEWEYNPKDLFFGYSYTEKEVNKKRYEYYQRQPEGIIVPRSIREMDDDVLPTGVKVKRVKHLDFSNYKIEGTRYKNLVQVRKNVDQLRIVPNPTSDVLRGETSLFSVADGVSVECQIIDISGKVVKNHANITGKIFEINVKDLPNGLYILRLKKEGQTQSCKFVKN